MEVIKIGEGPVASNVSARTTTRGNYEYQTGTSGILIRGPLIRGGFQI
jgi:hypothetical protein